MTPTWAVPGLFNRKHTIPDNTNTLMGPLDFLALSDLFFSWKFQLQSLPSLFPTCPSPPLVLSGQWNFLDVHVSKIGIEGGENLDCKGGEKFPRI